MRVTKRTNIAIRVLMYCADNSGRLVTKSEIATRCSASENHVAQVVNQLGQLGFLKTHRGRNGGLELARVPNEICIGEVFRAVEVAVPATECTNDCDSTCPLMAACRLRHALAEACEAFYAQLDALSLDMLVGGNPALLEAIAPQAAAHP